MPAPPIPVDRYLTPAEPLAAPEDFATVRQSLTMGVPLPIALDADFTVVLAVPTGLAGEWGSADPAAVVTSSASQTDPFDPAAPAVADVDRSGARLLIQRGGVNVASVPLTAGAVASVPSGTGSGRIEVMPIAWDLRAGGMVGPGDYGASITLAWRRHDTAVESYGPVPLNPFLRLRLPPMFIMQSIMVLATKRKPTIFERLRLRVPVALLR